MRRTSLVIVLMIASGLSANRALAMLQTHTTAAALITTSPQVQLQGTIYVSQEGSIYAISGSSVRRLALPSGGDWTQPRSWRTVRCWSSAGSMRTPTCITWRLRDGSSPG